MKRTPQITSSSHNTQQTISRLAPKAEMLKIHFFNNSVKTTSMENVADQDDHHHQNVFKDQN